MTQFMQARSRGRNFARLGAPRNGGDGVVPYVEPSIAGATMYQAIYASEIARQKLCQVRRTGAYGRWRTWRTPRS